MARKIKFFLTILALMILGLASAEEESQGHAHATSQTVQTSHSAGPSGTVTSVHSSSVDNGANDAAFATIANALADNPALAQAAAAALGGGGAAPGGFAGLNAARYGAQPGGPIGGGYPGGFPGGFPGGILGAFPGIGFGKGFNLNIDAGAGAGIGGWGGYFPIIEKAVVVVGGAILILLIIAFLQGTLSPGGFLHNLGGGFSKALAGAGSASVDVGPFHSGVSGAGSLGGGVNVGGASVNDPHFNNNVNNAINRRF